MMHEKFTTLLGILVAGFSVFTVIYLETSDVIFRNLAFLFAASIFIVGGATIVFLRLYDNPEVYNASYGLQLTRKTFDDGESSQSDTVDDSIVVEQMEDDTSEENHREIKQLSKDNHKNSNKAKNKHREGRGRKTLPDDKKLKALYAWDEIKGPHKKLEEFLEDQFGEKHGNLNVPVSTFHNWRHDLKKKGLYKTEE